MVEADAYENHKAPLPTNSSENEDRVTEHRLADQRPTNEYVLVCGSGPTRSIVDTMIQTCTDIFQHFLTHHTERRVDLVSSLYGDAVRFRHFCQIRSDDD